MNLKSAKPSSQVFDAQSLRQPRSIVPVPEIGISFVAIKMDRLEKQPTDPAAVGRETCLFRAQDISYGQDHFLARGRTA